MRGFNLDNAVSPDGEEASCGHGDLTSPSGEEGIDNQFAELWSTIYPIVGEQVNALLQNAINEGRVLVMVELEGVDDLYEDDQVSVRVFRGISRPDIGTRGLITPDQTFQFDYNSPITSVEDAQIQGGELTVGPVEFNIPLTILDLDIIAKIELGMLVVSFSESGELSGFLTGMTNVAVLSLIHI